jgi:hypothetical protein
MDSPQLDKSSEKLSELIKNIKEWLKKTDELLGYTQQSYKSSEETSKSIVTKIDKFLEENKWMEEKTNKTPEDYAKELRNSFHKMVENMEKMANVQGTTMTFQKKSGDTIIYLYCTKLNKLNNMPTLCGYSIKTFLYNKNDVGYLLKCYSDSSFSSNEIQCTYNNVLDEIISKFELPNSIYFIQDIKNKILKINKELYSRLLENLDKQEIHIKVIDRMNFENSENENPETFKYKVITGTKEYYVYQYNDNVHDIKVILGFDPSVVSYY